MAKGFRGGMGMGGNMSQVMAQAQRMYTEQMRKNQASELDKRLDDLNERSKNMGVPTDVHFGD